MESKLSVELPKEQFLGTKSLYTVDIEKTEDNLAILTEDRFLEKLIYVGRHGARFLTKKEKILPLFELINAQAKNLTEIGRILRTHLNLIMAASEGKYGEITRLGKVQLVEIAQRIADVVEKNESLRPASAENFPTDKLFFFGSSGQGRGDSSSQIVSQTIYERMSKSSTLPAPQKSFAVFPRPELVYFHKYGEKSKDYQEFKEKAEKAGIKELCESDVYKQITANFLKRIFDNVDEVMELEQLKQGTFALDIFKILIIIPSMMFEEDHHKELMDAYIFLKELYLQIAVGATTENALSFLGKKLSDFQYEQKVASLRALTIATPFLKYLLQEILTSAVVGEEERKDGENAAARYNIFLCHAEITIPLAAIFLDLEKMFFGLGIDSLFSEIGMMSGNLQWMLLSDKTIVFMLNEVPVPRKYIKWGKLTNNESNSIFITVDEFASILRDRIAELH